MEKLKQILFNHVAPRDLVDKNLRMDYAKIRHVIYLDAQLNHNQIYVEDADFDEVFDFIAARCVNAKGRRRRKTRKE